MLTTVPFKSVPGLDALVGEVMHHGLIALPATATLADVASTMSENKVHAVLITGTDGSPLGWVTSRGILHNHPRDWSIADSAAAAITQPAASVAPTATLADAMTVFVATGATHILVGSSDGRAPIGVIADSDLVAFVAQR
jgi:signal-transduction protein with cAMP-binding, CBS, and nucleotidyltransferase domain